ncbi:MAG: threonine-phosphate decarboxylase [Cellvibrionaceae bacterium]
MRNDFTSIPQVDHGGNIKKAQAIFGCPDSEWLDLSTGISPWVYPVPSVPETIWQNLPYDEESLLNAAQEYYACSVDMITPVAGSQDAIQRIPDLLSTTQVAIPFAAYQEHRRAWQLAGHEVHYYHNYQELMDLIAMHHYLHVVVINPNNPSAERWSIEQLIHIQQQLKQHCYLIVDEAFMDITPEQSLVSYISDTRAVENVLILRSIGKFFGLAGLRLGFVLGQGAIIHRLREKLQPWAVSHPAIWLGSKVLLDIDWQQQQLRAILQQSENVMNLLTGFNNCKITSAGLFITLCGDKALLAELYQKAGESGILFRYHALSEKKAWLRLGLPGENFQRLKLFFDSFDPTVSKLFFVASG